jgi:hypothetical protein
MPFPDGLSIWSGWHLQSFGDNYVADNSDGDAVAGLETNSRTGRPMRCAYSLTSADSGRHR